MSDMIFGDLKTMEKKFCSVELEFIKSDLNGRDKTMKLIMKLKGYNGEALFLVFAKQC